MGRAGWTAAACALMVGGAVGVALGASEPAPAAAGSSSGASSSVSQGLDVLPFPGTPDAAPGTNVDFPAVSPQEVSAVRVVGSRSGAHAGRLRALPDGRGTAFSPVRPFAPGERVSVSASLRSAAAGTASGAPGSHRLRFSFSIARPVRTPASAAGVPDAGAAGGRSAKSPKTQSFVTQPGFHVPRITMTGKDTDTASGEILLDARYSGQNAVYILSGRGQLRWYQPTNSSDEVYGLREQSYKGHPVLTYWKGLIGRGGLGQGQDVILNDSYQVIHTITPGAGYRKRGADQHEFTLTPQGTAYITIWKPVQANLTSIGGPPNGVVVDDIIQEIDIATGAVVWEWHALGHVPFTDSYAHYSPGKPWDYFHLNSIQQSANGKKIIISARHTWAVYSIEKKTGHIAWELGGKHSSFSMGKGTSFFWQHDATLNGKGLLTVFDDGASPKEEHQSRALEIHLNMAKGKARLVRAFKHKPPVLATSGGSMQLLPNRDVFVGWGTAPTFSEYDPAGKQLFAGSFKSPIQSYRAYRFPWTGFPTWAPAVAVRKTSTQNSYHVYVSWNGATRVAQWRVLAGTSSTGPFKPLKTTAWSGFETQIAVSTPDAYFEVKGLARSGKLLPHGISAPVKAP